MSPIIPNEYPEETPVTILSEAHPHFDKEILRDYLESLKGLLRQHIERHAKGVQENYISEKDGGSFKELDCCYAKTPYRLWVKLLKQHRLLPHRNFYTETFSGSLHRTIARHINIPVTNFPINAGSELILRQLILPYRRQVHLLTHTY